MLTLATFSVALAEGSSEEATGCIRSKLVDDGGVLLLQADASFRSGRRKASTPTQQQERQRRQEQHEQHHYHNGDDDAESVRFMTYNIEDLRHRDIRAALRGETGREAARVWAAAELIAAVNPDVLFVQELECRETSEGTLLPNVSSAADFSQILLEARAKLGVAPRKYGFFQQPSNTGVPSGMDLDHSGSAVLEPGSSAYGNDGLGFGLFPGHYAMALFVGEPLVINASAARTFQRLLRADMPGALLAYGDGRRVPTHEPWYSQDKLAVLRLSSKSHWDVPVIVPRRSGQARTVRAYLSHPTPPQYTIDTAMRNHDEIRFWASYALGEQWIHDDAGRRGGATGEPAVVMGDLNADASVSDARFDPLGVWLWKDGLFQKHLPASGTPTKDRSGRDMRAEDTNIEGMRLDYLLPTSTGLAVRRGAVVRGTIDLPPQSHAGGHGLLFNSSDHFPVWADFKIL